jgi:hypothetical protein
MTRLLVLSVALLLSCSHTETVKTPQPDEKADKAAKTDKTEKTASAKTAEPRRAEPHHAAKAPNPETGETPKATTAGTPVARNPETLIVPGQIKRIQEKLHDRGLLKAQPSGSLDDATRVALKRLQKNEDLPETGLPDHETVRKLGLDPDDVFAKRQ